MIFYTDGMFPVPLMLKNDKKHIKSDFKIRKKLFWLKRADRTEIAKLLANVRHFKAKF